MDSKDPTVRKYLAECANLLGAIRLPNTAFKANAGTDVVADIIFLQKREEPAGELPDWPGGGVQLGLHHDAVLPVVDRAVHDGVRVVLYGGIGGDGLVASGPATA